jgi:AAA15 family ATPase/GTPase
MFYDYNITTNKNTSKENYKTTTLRLTKGIIDIIEVVFPKGLAGLVGVKLLRDTKVVIPENRTGWLEGNNEVINIPANIDLLEPPFELVCQTYNLDDTYSHTIYVRVSVSIETKETIETSNIEAYSGVFIP